MERFNKRTLVRWIEKRTGEKEGQGFRVMSAKQGKEFSVYSCGKWFVSFDGSVMYDLFDGYPNWNFVNDFHQFLSDNGLWYERGEAWNLSVMEK